MQDKSQIATFAPKSEIGFGNLKTVNPENLDWLTVADYLDELAPLWECAVGAVKEIGDFAVITAAITINGVTRQAVGTGHAGSEKGIKNAEDGALVRAAVKFGIGREFYKTETASITAAKPETMFDKPANPRAKNLVDLITSKQLGLLKSLARENDFDLEEACHAFYPDLKTDELSKRAASVLIEQLQNSPTAESAQPLSTAAKASNVADFPAPPLENAESVELPPPAEQTKNLERWRETIRLKIGSAGVNPNTFLAAFDTVAKTYEQKKDAYADAMRKVLEVRRSQIKEALHAQPWEAAEIEGELINYGIEDGIDKASFAQIEKMWNDYKANRMIGGKK